MHRHCLWHLTIFVALASAFGCSNASGSDDGGSSGGGSSFTLISVAPSSGTPNGGTTVAVSGSGFSTVTINAITFGVLSASNVQVLSDTQISCETPVGTDGETVDLSISTAEQGVFSLSNAFTYTAGGTWSAISNINAPSPRNQHTAVWTDSLMIVWGGMTDGGRTDTGAMYDPLSDTWTTMAESTLFPGGDERAGHTAIWTGDEMIVWGGTDISGDKRNDGAAYDPATDTWSAISTLNAPEEREGHTAIWTGSEMIVLGGIGVSAQGGKATGGLYDPATDFWTTTDNSGVFAPNWRFKHSAVWTGTHMAISGGESASTGVYFNDTLLYDPTTDTWTLGSNDINGSREYHSAVWTGSDLIVWGGFTGNLLNTGAVVDLPAMTTTTTSLIGAVPDSREKHSAVWTGDLMIVWGGSTSSTSVANDGAQYDPTTDTWSQMTQANAPAARSSHVAIWTGSSMIVWGGVDGATRLGDGGIFTP